MRQVPKWWPLVWRATMQEKLANQGSQTHNHIRTHVQTQQELRAKIQQLTCQLADSEKRRGGLLAMLGAAAQIIASLRDDAEAGPLLSYEAIKAEADRRALRRSGQRSLLP